MFTYQKLSFANENQTYIFLFLSEPIQAQRHRLRATIPAEVATMSVFQVIAPAPRGTGIAVGDAGLPTSNI